MRLLWEFVLHRFEGDGGVRCDTTRATAARSAR
jgi:hypothetical protein